MDTFIRAYTLKHWSTHVVTLIQVHIPRDPPSGTRSDSALRPSQCSTVFAFEYIHRSCFCICLIATHTDIDTWVHACMQYIALHCITLRYITLHTYLHTYIHMHTHAYMHACTHAYMHTCTHAYMHACTHACMLTYLDTTIQKHRHRVRNDMHTYISTYLPEYMQTCIHTHSFQKRGLQRDRQTDKQIDRQTDRQT